MARGRMINQRIVKSQKFNRAIREDEGAGLLYCLLLAFADRDGRLEGDPDLVKAQIYPRIHLSEDVVSRRLRLLDEVGLIQWYQVGNDWFIQIEKFAEGQEGMRYEREKVSEIPEPPESHISGITPAVAGKGCHIAGSIVANL